MTKRIVKLFLILLAVLLLVYVAFQIYMVAYPNFKTQVALIKTVEDTVSATGIVVRDETVVEGLDSQGVYNYLIDNGDKVAKGSVVAEIYASSQDALDNLTLNLYQNEREILYQATDQGRLVGTNIDSLTTRLYKAAAAVAANMAWQDYGNLEESKLLLTELLTSYDVAMGNEIDVAARIEYLDSQIAAIQARNITPTGYVTAPQEGYFISSTDGMEAQVNKTDVLEMSVSEIARLAAQDTLSTSTSCKIVADYAWYYAAVVDAGSADRFRQGMSLTLDFDYSAVGALPVTVVAVKTEAGSDKAVVIVECRIFNAPLTELRCEEATLSFRNYSGFIVDRTYLRMEDGVVGVYIKYGSTIQFRRLDVIYETETYVVSRSNPADSGLLAMYDEIITQGRDLYVGKDLG